MQYAPITPADKMKNHFAKIKAYVNSPYRGELYFLGFSLREASFFPFYAKGNPAKKQLLSLANHKH